MLSLIIFFASQTPSPPPSPSPSLPPFSPLTSCWCAGFEGTGGLVPGDTFCNRNSGPCSIGPCGCISVNSSHWPEGHLETLEPLPGSLCPSDFTHCVYYESVVAEGCSLCAIAPILVLTIAPVLVVIIWLISAIWHKRHHPDKSWWASYKFALWNLPVTILFVVCLPCICLPEGGDDKGHHHHHAHHGPPDCVINPV